MIEPCIILTDEQAEKWDIIGMRILPGVLVAAFCTESQAKETAHRIGCQFSRIDFGIVVLGWK